MQILRGGRRQRNGEAHQSVGPELEADQQRSQRSRRRQRKLRQPGVQRHQGHLHAEADQAQQENGVLGRPWQRHRQQRQQVEGWHRLAGGEQHEGEQQRHATGQHDQEITRRHAGAAGGRTPAGDQKIDRRQRQFPEEKEEHRVERAEDAQRRALQQQQQAVVQARRVKYEVPAGHQAAEEDQRRCRQEQHRQAIDSDLVMHVEARDPEHALEQLEARTGRIEGDEDRSCRRQRRQHDQCRQAARRARREQPDDDGTEQRHEHEERKQVSAHRTKRAARL